MTKCNHVGKIIAERPFFGPVASGDNQWPPAHGGVTYEMECSLCGARRLENVNQQHREVGCWGPDRATRQTAAREAMKTAREAIAAVKPITCTRTDGLRLVLTLDEEGYVNARGDAHKETDVAAALRASGDFAARAQHARQLYLAAVRATHEAA